MRKIRCFIIKTIPWKFWLDQIKTDPSFFNSKTFYMTALLCKHVLVMVDWEKCVVKTLNTREKWPWTKKNIPRPTDPKYFPQVTGTRDISFIWPCNKISRMWKSGSCWHECYYLHRCYVVRRVYNEHLITLFVEKVFYQVTAKLVVRVIILQNIQNQMI